MAYTLVSDVQAHLPEFPILETSQPSVVEVGSFILQIEATVNGVLLFQGYPAVPVTGENDVAMLRGFVASKVAAMTWLAAFGADDTPDKVKQWSDDFAAFLNRLRQGQQRLVDQEPGVTQESEVRFSRIRLIPRIPDHG
jgi:hypothetical protein